MTKERGEKEEKVRGKEKRGGRERGRKGKSIMSQKSLEST